MCEIFFLIFVLNKEKEMETQNEKNATTLVHILLVVVLSVLLFATTTVISSVSYETASVLYGFLRGIDPDSCWLILTIHHILQGTAAFVLIFLVSRVLKLRLKDFGFSTSKFGYSLRTVLIFCAIWSVVQVIGTLCVAKIASVNGFFAFPLTFYNFLGYFLFEILFSGTSEEILFRALVIQLIIYLPGKFAGSAKVSNIAAVTSATIIFTLAHINFNLNPFQITYLNPLQLITCFLFGIFYGYLFIKTKSVIGPMIAHNMLNGVIAIVSLIIYQVFKL